MIDSNNTSDLFNINITEVNSDSFNLRWAYGSIPILVLSIISGFIIR